MVDFSRKTKNRTTEAVIDPIEIYENLDRSSEKGPLRNDQIEILDKWYASYKNNSNTILKMNTGKGKTLIGLLILQSKLNELHRPVMYICPNKNLVNQTVLQAKQFGLKTCTVDDSNTIPLEFANADAIFITHVQFVFNGLSKFNDIHNYPDCAAIVVDDSHAVVDSIKKSTRFSITKKVSEDAYHEIFKLFEDDIQTQGMGSYSDMINKNQKRETMLPVPYWSLKAKTENLTRILSNYSTRYNEIKFVWPLLQNEISDTDCYISNYKIEIVPYILPIEKFHVFDSADNIIYMSATTADDSVMVKDFNLSKQDIINPLKLDSEKWSGEKMILMPDLMSEDLNRSELVHLFATRKTKFGIVALTPSFYHTRDWKEYGAKIAESDNINEILEQLGSNEKFDTVVLSNRYDGIDLPDSKCRVLIIDSIPIFNTLENQYLSSVIPNSSIVNQEIAQKIEQGLGRSVRGEKDYSAIVILGTDLVNFLKKSSNQKYFSNYTKQQIHIGEQIVQFSKEDIKNGEDSQDVFIALLNQILTRDSGWKEFYSEQMDDVKSITETTPEIIDRYVMEKKFYRLYRDGQIDKAIQVLQKFIDLFIKNTKEKGYYLQIKAKMMYKVSIENSIILQEAAHKSNLALLAHPSSIYQIKIQQSDSNYERIENIKSVMESYNSHDLTLFIQDLDRRLSFGNKAHDFEGALDSIGELLGFKTQRPDKDIKEGPDNLWAVGDHKYIIFECKNEVSTSRKHIYKSEMGQMSNSIGWFNRVYPGNSSNNYIIIPTLSYDSAGDFTQPVRVIRQNKLNLFRKNVVNFLKELINKDFDLTHERINKLLNMYNLNLEDLFESYSESPKTWNT